MIGGGGYNFLFRGGVSDSCVQAAAPSSALQWMIRPRLRHAFKQASVAVF